MGASESDYSYHHIQEFTTDTNTYQNALRKTTCSGGGDDFESGMDGLMQTIACEGKTKFISSFINIREIYVMR